MKYLFLSPHIDDADLMCGGTISKSISNGHEVTICTFALEYDGVDLSNEFFESVNLHGAIDLVFQGTGTGIRQFHTKSDDILQYLFRISKYGYDYVFTPSVDYHSDHSVIAKAAVRVFKYSNLLSYCPDWNERKFIKNYFVKLEDRHVQKKLEALKCYKSQQDKAYFKEEYLLGSLHVNGLMSNCKFAEAFQVVNLHA